jgi:F-type H+-transporting ATPase subunit b
MLGFDIPTFVFQIVNFLILLTILARFFYRPVLQVVQRRQEQIDARLAEAEAKARQADAERESLARRSEVARREAAALLESARSDAAQERKRLVESARADAASLIEEARRTAAAEEQAALKRLSGRLAESAVQVAGGLIREAAGREVHYHMLQRLVEEGFGADERAALTAAGRPRELLVESAYPLEPAQERALQAAVAMALGELAAPSLKVHEDGSLLAGVRLTLGDVVVDMSLRRLLRQLTETEDGARRGG